VTILTADELFQLTGYRIPSRQCRAIAEAGLRYIKRRDGRPAVTWEAIHQHQLGMKAKKEQDQSPNLDFLKHRHGSQTKAR
jgi:Domain of unknown function (DUF4224)